MLDIDKHRPAVRRGGDTGQLAPPRAGQEAADLAALESATSIWLLPNLA